MVSCISRLLFPFLFGGTFIEGRIESLDPMQEAADFPSFSEGLSLRAVFSSAPASSVSRISLPFRRDFH